MEKEKAIKWWRREYLPANLFILSIIVLILINGSNTDILCGGGFLSLVLCVWNGYSVYHYKKMVKDNRIKPFGEK